MLKNKTKLLNISKVASMFGLKNSKSKKASTHTLRFWEKKFKQLRPTILSGGRRYYSEKDIEVVKMIIFLLKEQGLTINGAIKAMNYNPKELDDANTISIRDSYYTKNIVLKSKKLLEKIKKLNGKKNTY
jgi:DNA-binding transcriptional MerR regulator